MPNNTGPSKTGPAKTLHDFDVLAFDCYGTLIDWESGMVAGLSPLIEAANRHLGRDQPLTRDQILEAHARHESGQQAQHPRQKYTDLLATVYRRLAEEWGIGVDWAACQAYGRSVAEWPAFADSIEALSYLKQHYKLVILSNVDNASFAASNARLGVTFDAVFSAEDVGAYKPSDRNFAYMLSHLAANGIERGQILHTAESLFHDHVPANRHDLATCWIWRRHAQPGFGATRDPGTMPRIDFRFTSLAELVKTHQETR